MNFKNEKILNLYQSIIDQFNTEDNYVYGLIFRELLFHLTGRLHSHIKVVFEKFRDKLNLSPNLSDEKLRSICESKYNNATHIQGIHYNFKNWQTNPWILAEFFSPTLAKHPDYDIDAQSLLYIIINFKGFKVVRQYAKDVNLDRCKYYGHTGKRGIYPDQFDDCFNRCKLLLEELDEHITEIAQND
jgi:hypothetical protein